MHTFPQFFRYCKRTVQKMTACTSQNNRKRWPWFRNRTISPLATARPRSLPTSSAPLRHSRLWSRVGRAKGYQSHIRSIMWGRREAQITMRRVVVMEARPLAPRELAPRGTARETRSPLAPSPKRRRTPSLRRMQTIPTPSNQYSKLRRMIR